MGTIDHPCLHELMAREERRFLESQPRSRDCSSEPKDRCWSGRYRNLAGICAPAVGRARVV